MCSSKAFLPFLVILYVVKGFLPINCFLISIKEIFSNACIWLARFPSVTSNKFFISLANPIINREYRH